MTTTTKHVPVNAPTAESAVSALVTELGRRGITVIGTPTALGRHTVTLPDDAVAITVTKPDGPRSTWTVSVDVMRTPGR